MASPIRAYMTKNAVHALQNRVHIYLNIAYANFFTEVTSLNTGNTPPTPEYGFLTLGYPLPIFGYWFLNVGKASPGQGYRFPTLGSTFPKQAELFPTFGKAVLILETCFPTFGKGFRSLGRLFLRPGNELMGLKL